MWHEASGFNLHMNESCSQQHVNTAGNYSKKKNHMFMSGFINIHHKKVKLQLWPWLQTHPLIKIQFEYFLIFFNKYI